MADMIRTSRSEFIKNIIENYSNNRIGQFSKYLDTEPTYVTYYHVNLVHSRADLGTDAIDDVLGSRSPIRYNKITQFPVFIKGGLDPDTNIEDGMINSELEISDITILPGTIKPSPFDHFIVELPNMVPILFRVNSFRNLTIQSNDFYSIAAHAIEFGNSNLSSIERLVVESYKCIEANIGTQDSCFIRSDLYDISNELQQALSEMKEIYRSIYYNAEVNSYIYNEEFFFKNMLVDPSMDYRQRDLPFVFGGIWIPPEDRLGRLPALLADRRNFMYFRCFVKPNPNIDSRTQYDLYMTKFITNSQLFSSNTNYDHTSAVSYEDLLPLTFDINFKRTVWYAVLTKNTRLLEERAYYFLAPIRKEMSSIVLCDFPSPSSVILNLNTSDCTCGLSEYFPKELLHDLVHGRVTEKKCECEEKLPTVIKVSDILDHPEVDFNQKMPSTAPYKMEELEKNEEEKTEADKKIEYFNDIIYNYIYDIDMAIDTDKLIVWLADPCFTNFEYYPMIMYILNKKIHSLFERID